MHLWSINLCKGGKNIQWKKDNLFLVMLGKLDNYK